MNSSDATKALTTSNSTRDSTQTSDMTRPGYQMWQYPQFRHEVWQKLRLGHGIKYNESFNPGITSKALVWISRAKTAFWKRFWETGSVGDFLEDK